MGLQELSTSDKYDLGLGTVLLSGTQALVRLMLLQKASDAARGLNTAGYVTGYRGSPLAHVDMQMQRAQKHLSEADIVFQPGLNEDLAATALWGTQQAELRGEGRFDGVFGLWYGKGPGIDRSGDAMRHANMAGTSRFGGVIMAMGDDHTGESSSTCHQSDFAVIDTYMPVVSPAGVQEILEYGLYGFALSRYSGLWVGMKCVKETVESSAIVDGSLPRTGFSIPDFKLPPDGLNIRLNDHWVDQEVRLLESKRWAAEAFARSNRIDKRVHGEAGAKIGLVSAGKNWLDLSSALDMLGLDDAECRRRGITTYKVGQIWPLDMKSFREWADGLDLIVVIEDKRFLLEVQVKEAIFNDRRGRRVCGYWDENFDVIFPSTGTLDALDVAVKLGGLLEKEGVVSEELRTRRASLQERQNTPPAAGDVVRKAWFCSGCPHNTSTKVPEGARADLGIGCHFMARWMDRSSGAYTHMGGEGAAWIGEAPFSSREHIFQNMGDGTYNHSGSLAIRAAISAGVNITFKILYNDAVAMTGGQTNDGNLSPQRIAHELHAMGVAPIAVVYDPKEEPDLAALPKSVETFTRDRLMQVQEQFATKTGVSAIIYVQTCAAEKRRRAKRKPAAARPKHVFINPDICEGCGDCGVQSNCIAIQPLDTELGTKRRIDQSSCNKDYSCIDGFCPSFTTVENAQLRKQPVRSVDASGLAEPQLPSIEKTLNILLTGIGGTGVVTIGSIIAQAALNDDKGVGMIEVGGIAQKGGTVFVHLRLAEAQNKITSIRLSPGEADLVIGCDLVATTRTDVLGMMQEGRSHAVINCDETITGDFVSQPDFRIPGPDLQSIVTGRIGAERATFLNAADLSHRLLGDTIHANMVAFGAAWQTGQLPISLEAIRAAIKQNGAAVEANLKAFEIGRWAVAKPDEVSSILKTDQDSAPRTLDEKIAFRAAHLEAYQDRALADRYLRMLASIEQSELKEAVAKGYHKLLSYKDEYEVARLHLKSEQDARRLFHPGFRMSYHLAPPLLPGKDTKGRPKKRRFGPWIRPIFKLLARGKALRGTKLDPFGYSRERRLDRSLIEQYEADLRKWLPRADEVDMTSLIELAELPLSIRGFGVVKEANASESARRREVILDRLRIPPQPLDQAAE